MKYFQNCTTLNECKAEYKKLAKLFHPDVTGDEDRTVIQGINKEYEFCIAKLAKGENLTDVEIEAEILNAEQYKDAINAIINLQGITIELCGGWIWVSGNTYPVKHILKDAKFYFASGKKMWYFRSVEYATNNRKKHTMDEIRTKYGSTSINSSYSNKLIA